MTAPFNQIELSGQDLSLPVAFIIGISFGFFLEKGGLGSSKKLTGQFYFTDMTVFKVMFTAIITAMCGLFILSWSGFLDLPMIKFTPTYGVPYLFAGLIFGSGFVIGGLCPGTSCVSAVTGRIDGIVVMVGILAGIFIFGETFESFSGFLYSTPMYQISIPEFFKTSYGLSVFLIVIIAIAGFMGAEKLEKIISIKSGIEANSLKPAAKKFNRFLAACAVILAVAILFLGDPYKPSFNNVKTAGISLAKKGVRIISSEDLAKMFLTRDSVFIIVDLRTPEEFESYHIPSAINLDHNQPLDELKDSGVKVIFYSDGNRIDKEILSNLAAGSESNFYFLNYGIRGWLEDIVFPDLNIPKGYSPEEEETIVNRSRYFGGNPRINKAEVSLGEKYIKEGC